MRQPYCEPLTPSSGSVVTWYVLNRPLLPDNKSLPPLLPTIYLAYWLLSKSVRRCPKAYWKCSIGYLRQSTFVSTDHQVRFSGVSTSACFKLDKVIDHMV